MATELATQAQAAGTSGIDAVKVVSGLTNTGLGLFLVGWLMTSAVPKLESAHHEVMAEVSSLRVAVMQQTNAYDKLTMEIRESRLSRERDKKAHDPG